MQVQQARRDTSVFRGPAPVVFECINMTDIHGPTITEWGVKFVYDDLEHEVQIGRLNPIYPGCSATLLTRRQQYCIGYIAYAKWEWSDLKQVKAVKKVAVAGTYIRASSIRLATTRSFEESLNSRCPFSFDVYCEQ